MKTVVPIPSPLFAPDNIHPSTAGFGVHADRLKPMVEKFRKP